MKIKKTILFVALICMAGSFAFAQKTITLTQPVAEEGSAELQSFKNQVQAANPGMKVVSVNAVREATLAPVETPTIAIFVKNQTRVQGMDDMVDGIRDRMSAELAGAGMIVMDQADMVSAFNRYKVTTAEERAGLIDGVFTGGSTLRVAQMLGADYIMVASVISANRMQLTVSGKPMVTYTLRMTVKVNEAVQGTSVYGANWSRKLPVTGEAAGGTDGMFFYNDLIDLWANETGVTVAQKISTWRRAHPQAVQLASVSFRTTLDELVDGLENGVRASNELLDEMRRMVGGATIEVDGATIGSSPGTFQVSPGLHQVRISRQWMKDWQGTVNIQDGSSFRVALELSDAGLQRFQSLERCRAQIARDYAVAASQKNVKINFDTAAWRDVSLGADGSDSINVQVQ